MTQADSRGMAAMERCCRNAGMVPEKRLTLEGREIFIADGFCPPDKVFAFFERMGVKRDEFPFGCYATIWWLAKDEDDFTYGRPIFFDAFHDTGWDAETKKKARVNMAIQDASGFLKRKQRYAKNGFSVN